MTNSGLSYIIYHQGKQTQSFFLHTKLPTPVFRLSDSPSHIFHPSTTNAQSFFYTPGFRPPSSDFLTTPSSITHLPSYIISPLRHEDTKSFLHTKLPTSVLRLSDYSITHHTSSILHPSTTKALRHKDFFLQISLPTPVFRLLTILTNLLPAIFSNQSRITYI